VRTDTAEAFILVLRGWYHEAWESMESKAMTINLTPEQEKIVKEG